MVGLILQQKVMLLIGIGQKMGKRKLDHGCGKVYKKQKNYLKIN